MTPINWLPQQLLTFICLSWMVINPQIFYMYSLIFWLLIFMIEVRQGVYLRNPHAFEFFYSYYYVKINLLIKNSNVMLLFPFIYCFFFHFFFKDVHFLLVKLDKKKRWKLNMELYLRMNDTQLII